MAAKRTTIYLDDTDRHALTEIQARYGLSTFSTALRFALRTMAALSSGKGGIPNPPRHGPHPDEAHLPQSSAPGRQGVMLLSSSGPPPTPLSQDKRLEFLTEELASTQEALAQEQEKVVALQEALEQTHRELQALKLFEMQWAADPPVGRPPNLPPVVAEVRADGTGTATVQYAQQLLAQSSQLRAEAQRIRHRAEDMAIKLFVNSPPPTKTPFVRKKA